MTFVEIKSKGRPCSFLSNNVKNDVNTAQLLSIPCFLAGVTDKADGKKKTSTCLNIGAFTDGELRGGRRRNYENYLQLSKIQGDENSWEEAEL